MTVKRLSRIGSTSGYLSYTLDRGQKHKELDPATPHELIDCRDPQLIMDNSRAITVAGDNVDPYDPEGDFSLIRAKFDKKTPKNQAGSYVLSLDDQAMRELSSHLHQELGHYPSDIEKFDEIAQMGLELGELVAGNGNRKIGKDQYQIAVQTHWKPNNYHAHIEVATINLDTGTKDMNYERDELTKLYGYADQVYQERGLTTGAGLEVIRDKDGHRITQRKGGYDAKHQGSRVDQLTKKGKYSYVDDLNYQFELVMSKAKDKKDAKKGLKEKKIVVDRWDDNHKFIKLHWEELKTDIIGRRRTEDGHYEKYVKQAKGTPSRSIRLKTYTREQADLELEQPTSRRLYTDRLLSDRRRKYMFSGNPDKIAQVQQEAIEKEFAKGEQKSAPKATTRKPIIIKRSLEPELTLESTSQQSKSKPRVPKVAESKNKISDDKTPLTPALIAELLTQQQKALAKNKHAKELLAAYKAGLVGDDLATAKANAQRLMAKKQEELELVEELKPSEEEAQQESKSELTDTEKEYLQYLRSKGLDR